MCINLNFAFGVAFFLIQNDHVKEDWMLEWRMRVKVGVGGSGHHRRGVAQGCSKWLREENSGGWGEISGKDKDLEFQNSSAAPLGGLQREERKGVEDNIKTNNKSVNVGREKEGIHSIIQKVGPGSGELDGLIVEDKKRQRTGPVEIMDLDNESSIKTTGVGLSDKDCTEPSSSILAKLAVQAS